MSSSDKAVASELDPVLPAPNRRWRKWALVALPLILLFGALAAFTAMDDRIFGLIGDNPPPPDQLSVSRVLFEEGEIVVRVTNPQPQPISIGAVTVDNAIVNFSVDGNETLGRFDGAKIRIPFHWNEGEPYVVGITSGSGIQTTAAVTAAVARVKPNPSSIFGFGLIGLLVGVLPVALGLFWLPALRNASRNLLAGFMALTAGLLVFLTVDATFEALEQSAALPGSFGGLGLIILGASLSFVGVGALSGALTRRAGKSSSPSAPNSIAPGASGLALATAIAAGIGFHNLGEGLAIGASFAVGELAFSSLLIIGFTVHNITEGLAIAVPLADRDEGRVSVRKLAGLALIAGLPAVLGAWIGGFITSAFLATFFFAVAAGAAAQVVAEVVSYIRGHTDSSWRTPYVAGGFVAGVGIMYVTSLIAG